jgi:gliding motility-associated-like protein
MARTLFIVFLIGLTATTRAQCGYQAFVHTNKDYCLGSSLLAHSAHTLKKIVWYKDGKRVDSAMAKESLDSCTTITLNGAGANGGLVSDQTGNVYTIDYEHERIVRWTPGTGTGVTTVGAYTLGDANFLCLFVDHQNNIYLSNSTQQVVLKYTPGDTIGVPAVHLAPQSAISSMYVDCNGTIYLCDEVQQTITKWGQGATSGTVVTKASTGGGPDATPFSGPFRVDSLGNITAMTFNQLTQWAPGATSGVVVFSWNLENIFGQALWLGGDDTALVMGFPLYDLAWITAYSLTPAAPAPTKLGSFLSHQAGGHAAITMDGKGDILGIDDADQVIYELRRHSSIDSGFTPSDTGVYYAVVTDMQGYAAMTNKISINSPYSGTASIAISATATSTPVCTPITFTASSANFGQDPSFQWQVSGVPAGGDSTTYSYNLFANGDPVYCILTAQAGCAGPVQDTSNVITLSIDAQGAAAATISTPKDSICQGDTAIFTANVTGGSNQPVFQWLVNGDSTGDVSASFNGSQLPSGDVVTCLITSDDACGLAKSNSIPLTVSVPPTIEPGQVFTVLHGHSVTLEPVTSGNIDSWRWTPATGLSDTTIADPEADPDANTLYTLTVTAPGGCSATGAILVNVYTPLSIPGAFTPNGDGHNDDFYVLGGPVNSVVEDFAVFNRFGAEIFHAHDMAPGDKTKAWDGRFRGEPAPMGTYVYVVVMKLASGSRQVYKGTVVLVR